MISKTKLFLRPVLLLFLISCAPSVTDLVRKAKEALSDEDAYLAEYYFQRAYESSLDESLFIIDRRENFSDLLVSHDRYHLVATRNLDEGSEFFYYDFKTKEGTYKSLEGQLRIADISSRGSYLTFLTFSMKKNVQKKTCSFEIWNQPKDEFLRKIEGVSCASRPATSETGEILFVQDGQIKMLQIRQGQIKNEYVPIAKLPKSPVSGELSQAWFTFSFEGHPFMTYGIAGSYHLYGLSKKQLRLISKRGSSYKIFFIGTQSNPGIITGGAGKYKINFFSRTRYENILYKRSIGTWKDIAFIDKNQFYYIKSDRLYSRRDQKEKALLFLAEKIFIGPGEEAVFLSSLGTPMFFDNPTISRLSRTIFDKVLDINELN